MMVNGDHTRSNPTVQILDWDCRRYLEDPTAQFSPSIVPYEQVLASLQLYLPSNRDDGVPPADGDSNDFDSQADAFSGDDFRMFEFKVRKCAVVQSHDWTACPYAHPGEKARRRDPRRYHYSGSACPDFRRGACERGDSCEYAHGVFECWLHPARYRTQACKDGTLCRRRVCFFAHTPEQLRFLPHADCADNSPRSGPGHKSVVSTCLLDFSPKSTLYYPPSLSPATASPPSSPSGSMSLKSVDQLSDSLRFLQLSKMRKSLSLPASSSLLQVGSRRSPAIPITVQARPRRSFLGGSFEEEPLMERVESGRELREKIYAKIGEENSLDRVGRVRGNMGASPEFGWDNS